jgi:hypothetical protein
MIIKIKKNWKDFVDGAPHEALQDDPSRRDFLKRGIYASGMFVMGPAMLSLLRPDRAVAAAFEAAYRNVNASYVLYEASGGCGFTAIAAPYDKDGRALTGNAELGWANGSTEDVSLISGLSLNTQDEFLRTIMRGGAYANIDGTSQEALASAALVQQLFREKVSGTMISCQTADDSIQNNYLNLHLVQKMRMGKVMQALAIGDNARSGNAVFNSSSESGKGFNGVASNTIEQLVGAVRAPVSESNPNESIMDRMARAVASLSTIQSKRDFGDFIGRKAFDERFNPAIQANGANFDPNYGKNLLDVTAGTFKGKNPFGANLLTPNLINSNSANGIMDKGYIASLSAAHRQIASGLYVERGGFDYHPNNNPNVGHRMHAELARFVIMWALTAQAEGKPSMLMMVSDGSIAWNMGDTDQGNRHVAAGDRGTFSTPLIFFFHPTKKVETKQIGHFVRQGNGFSTARETAVGKEGRMIGFAGALTFAKFAGLIDKASDRSFKDLAASAGITLSDADLNSLCGVG